MRSLSPRRLSSWLATATIAIFAGAVGQPIPVQAAPALPATTPSGPATNLRVTSTSAGAANLAWDAADWGSSSLHKYSVLVNGNVFAGCTNIAVLNCRVTGGANANTVALGVRALGDVTGEYVDATPTVQTTLLPPPDAPGGVAVAVSGSQKATVQWTAPASWHLNTIKKYDVLVDDEVYADCDDITATTCTFNDSAGVHSVVVRSVGNVGLQADADPVPVTLVTAPAAPTDIQLTDSDAGTGTITWTEPDWQGNSNGTFTVRVDDTPVPACTGITAMTCSFSADALSVTVVVTAIGDSPNLTASSAATPLTLLPAPGEPENIHATDWGVGSATVTWDPVEFNGSERNTYTVLADGSPVCEEITGTECVISGDADSTVSVTVRAVGDVGLVADSAPEDIDLPGLPDAVTGLMATTRTLGSTRIEWIAPADWHLNETQKYTVSVDGEPVGDCTEITDAFCVLTDPTPDTAVSVTVRAIGNTDDLVKDETLDDVDIPGVPDAPTDVHATSTTAGEAEIAWTAPNWRHNTDRTYVVTVDGVPADCDDDEATACHIEGGDSSADVQVTAVGDDAGTLSSAPSETVSIPLVAKPTGAVGEVTVTATPGNDHVVVAWSALTDNGGDWSNGDTNVYQVTIDGPDGAAITGCDAPVTALTCTFTTDKDGSYTATVTAANEAGPSADSTDSDPEILVLHAPTGQVANLTATPHPGLGDVDVDWDALDELNWNGAEDHSYDVTIDKPDDAMVTPGTCTPSVDEPGCSFTTDMAGEYTVHVTPHSEAGAGEAKTVVVTVALDEPSAAVTDLHVTPAPGTGAVHVTWLGIAEDAWEGAEHHYDVAITGPGGEHLTDNTCADLATDDATTATSCDFTTDTAGDYTVTVTAHNEVGASLVPAASADGHVTTDAPSGPVAGLTVDTTPGSGTVDVSWDDLDPTAWNSAAEKSYTITVTGPTGNPVGDAGTCTTVDADDDAECSFTATVAGDYTVTVEATSEAGDSDPAEETGHVTLVAPTGVVTGLDITTEPGSDEVSVTWDAMTDGWSEGEVHQYEVAITGVSTTANLCAGTLTTPSCSFTATTSGPFTVTVKAVNEVDTATNGTSANDRVVFVPTASVSGLEASAAAGSSTVEVTWDQLTDSDWLGGTSKKYTVTVDGPTGTELSDDTCTAADIADSGDPSQGCTFDATLSGDYEVTVAPINEAGLSTGTAATATAHLVLAPVATVTGLEVQATAGESAIQVVWDQADEADWNGAVDVHNYVVTITGPDDATVTAGDCTTVADTTGQSCEFSTDLGGDYTVQVALENDAGTSENAASGSDHLTLIAPTGQVGAVTVTNTAGSGDVDLSWPALGDAGWSEGETRTYEVAISGVTASPNGCSGAVSATTCSFTATTPGPFTVTVKAVNEVGTAATGGSGSGTIVFTPTGTVSGLDAGTSVGSATVSVSWSQLLSGWQGAAAKQYAVTVTPPTGGTLSDDGCTTASVPDSDTPQCTFDVSAGGDYVVHVAPQNEAGPGTAVDDTAHVTLVPTATIGTVTVSTTAGSPTVGVSWPALTAWNGGGTNSYAITIQKPTGATLGSNTCTTVADVPTPSCSFTTDTPGAYTAQVAAVNEAGTATNPTSGSGTLGSGVPAHATEVAGAPDVNAINASWTAATPTGLAAVASYTVTATADGYPTKSCSGTVTGTSCTISDVAAGVAYTVHVVTNGPGGSSTAADSADPVLPTGAPVAPIAVPTDAVPVPSGSTTPGATITITGGGYDPFSIVVLSLFTDPVSMGTTTADANGNISVTVTLPSGTPTGSHTLLATGLDPDGKVLNLAKPVTVRVVTPPTTTPPVITPPTTTPPTTTPPTTTPPTTTPPTTTPPTTTPPAATLPTGAVGGLTAKLSAAGTRGASVTWTAGQVAWGTGTGRTYRVTVDGPDDAEITGSCTTPVASTTTSCAFTTNTNGTYAVRVVAATNAGASAQSASTSITLNTAPGAPTAVAGTAGANSVTVTWKPPTTGTAVTGYTVTATAPYYPVRSCATPVTRSPCTITGLAAGVRYVPRVVAVGKGGNSAQASSATTLRPSGIVQEPQAVPSIAVNAGSRVAKPGARLALSGTGFRGATRVLLNLYPGGRSLGSATTSSSGALSASVALPAALAGDSYTVLATGLDSDGRARYLATSVRVTGTGATVFTQAGGGSGVRAVTVAQTRPTSSAVSRLTVTGPAAGPVMLAGFVMIMTGLLLTTAAGRRPRRAPAK